MARSDFDNKVVTLTASTTISIRRLFDKRRFLRRMLPSMGVDSVQPLPRKLAGYEFYRQVLGSPKFVVAPMVEQSELVRVDASIYFLRILTLLNYSLGGSSAAVMVLM